MCVTVREQGFQRENSIHRSVFVPLCVKFFCRLNNESSAVQFVHAVPLGLNLNVKQMSLKQIGELGKALDG